MRMQWNKKRILYVCLTAVILYLIFRVRTQDVKFEITINGAKAMDVWEFVADFSNMKILNPTMVDFNILAESGNYDHWQYSVQYTEFLSHLTFVRNTAHAHFNVKPEGDAFVIRSTHTTCFVRNLGCLKSVSEFWFSPIAESTRCWETVTYECPVIFSALCHREVMYQRKLIMSNLQKQFSNQRKLK